VAASRHQTFSVELESTHMEQDMHIKKIQQEFSLQSVLLSICCYLRKWVQATERYIDVLISEEESARDGETYSSNEFYKLRVSLQD
jgi:hypothetical protein